MAFQKVVSRKNLCQALSIRNLHLGRLCYEDGRKHCTPTHEEHECIPDPNAIDPCNRQPIIVIVGGGMAGISAANRLVKCGIKNVTVLEASNRVGGRICTTSMGKNTIEIGAQWIEGSSLTNPIYLLANQEGLLKNATSRVIPKHGIYFKTNGEIIDNKITQPTQKIMDNIIKQAQSLFSLSWEDHGSLRNFITKGIKKEIKKFPQSLRNDAMCIFNNKLNGVQCRWGEDAGKMAAALFGSFKTIPFGVTAIPSGYTKIFEPLIKVLPESCVKLNKEVSLVKWASAGNTSPRAVVICSNGEMYPADYVIITLPLGVLKYNPSELFSPTLPEEKKEAIKKLGFGNINKIFMEFEKPFWLPKQGYLMPAWTLEELCDKSNWIKSIHMIEEAPGCSSTLMCSVGGEDAKMVEYFSEDVIAQEVTHLMRKFLQDPSIPFPKRVLKTSWVCNKHFFGSVSYMSLESLEGHQIHLGSPLPSSGHSTAPILLFAGEATCPGYFSTVQGARLSGLREADRVLGLTKTFGGPPPCAEFVDQCLTSS